MQFLNAIFLAAVPLLSIPVILHLLRRRQREIIPWGAMPFLVESVRQHRSLRNLRDIPLLLVRTAALAALVFALAQPLVRSSWLGTTATREFVVILDNSMSMARTTSTGTLHGNTVSGNTVFQQQLERLEDFLDGLSEADSLRIMTAAQGPHWLTREPVAATADGKDRLLALCHDQKPSEGEGDFTACLELAMGLDAGPDLLQREIVVFTDGQAHGWHADEPTVWKRLEERKKNAPLATGIQIVRCGPTTTELTNRAVTRFEAPRTLVAIDQETVITTEVTNTGTAPTTASSLQCYLAEQLTQTMDIPALQPKQSHTVEWKHTFKEPGVYRCNCKLTAADDLLLDDQSTVIMEAVKQIPVLYVHDRLTQSTPDEAAWLFLASLGYDKEGGNGRWQSVFRPQIISRSELANQTFSDYHVIVLANATQLDNELLEKLREFVHSGGGLWVILGARQNTQSFNTAWGDEGVGLSPLSLDRLVQCPEGQENHARFRIHAPDAEHTATEHLADTQRLDLDQARLRRYYQFMPSPDKNISVLLATGNGKPLVCEHRIGEGRVIVQAIPFELDWSNFPSLKSFVVSVHDWLSYLADPAKTHYNLASGDTIELPVPADSPGTTVRISTPDQESVSLSHREDDFHASYRYRQTDLPGNYSVQFLNGTTSVRRVPFHIARESRESFLQPLDPSQSTLLQNQLGIAMDSELSISTSDISHMPRQKPLWWGLLGILLALLAVELALASRRSLAYGMAQVPSLPTMLGSASGATAE